MLLVTLAAVAAAGWLAVRHDEQRRAWRWRELSLEARLREATTRGLVFERALARLRTDYVQGTLQLNDDYRPLFERLTAEARPGE